MNNDNTMKYNKATVLQINYWVLKYKYNIL